ncbi:MAG: cell division protein ZapA [Ruminococcus sp.]|nr:cell division protein ZapA [Ruminococcus sp.]
MEKKRVSVQIDGRSYVVITEDDDAYVKGIAQEVSDHLLTASRTAKNLDTRDCAILTALDFCDDTQRERRRNKDLVEKADQIMQHTNELNKKCTDYRNRLTDAMNEVTRLTKRIRALEDQLRTLNRENERLRKFEPKKTDAEKQFEKTVQEKRAEKAMGYVPMEQCSLFDDEQPAPAPKGKKKHGKH